MNVILLVSGVLWLLLGFYLSFAPLSPGAMIAYRGPSLYLIGSQVFKTSNRLFGHDLCIIGLISFLAAFIIPTKQPKLAVAVILVLLLGNCLITEFRIFQQFKVQQP